jgi:hypothetical protein
VRVVCCAVSVSASSSLASACAGETGARDKATDKAKGNAKENAKDNARDTGRKADIKNVRNNNLEVRVLLINPPALTAAELCQSGGGLFHYHGSTPMIRIN